MFYLPADIAFGEAKAVTDWPFVAARFGAHKFAQIGDGKTRSLVTVIDHRTVLIGTEAIRFFVHTIELIVLEVMKHCLALDWATFTAAFDALGYRALII